MSPVWSMFYSRGYGILKWMKRVVEFIKGFQVAYFLSNKAKIGKNAGYRKFLAKYYE